MSSVLHFLHLRHQNRIADNRMKRYFNLNQPETFEKFRISKGKRLFDIVFSLIALIVFLPFMLIIMIAIKLESKGPVIYASRRVGTGYDIFWFYKFRSMKLGSEEQLSKFSDLNIYLINKTDQAAVQGEEKCPDCEKKGEMCSTPLFIGGTTICENWYFELKRRQGKKTTFFKAKDDPRVTKVGRIIRKFNLDELPQLYNVLKGDMSIVGNRPIPLYEAEKLTTDQWSYRFLAPAGITGLWQIEKNRFHSEEERIMLDNQYAVVSSPMKDIQIILKTIPTFFRKTNY